LISFQAKAWITIKRVLPVECAFVPAECTLGEDEVNQAFEKIVEEINQNTPYSLRT
jgi:phenylalanyl-tRNA synthetase beta subunit